MLATVQAAQATGALRPEVDAASFAGRLCQSMLDLGVGMFRASRGYGQMPALTARVCCCRALPCNLRRTRPWTARGRTRRPSRRSRSGRRDPEEADDRGAALRVAARAEFGRRGYEATTIRDIAAAAGVSTGSVYRLIDSKEELLVSVMQSFSATVTAGWEAVLAADATSVEKLDALMWINVNVLDRYSEEFRIQLGWVLESPPAADLGWAFKARLRKVKSLLQSGARAGDIQLPRGSIDSCAQSVLELIWIPETLVRVGTRPALALARDTLLRGAAARTRS